MVALKNDRRLNATVEGNGKDSLSRQHRVSTGTLRRLLAPGSRGGRRIGLGVWDQHGAVSKSSDFGCLNTKSPAASESLSPASVLPRKTFDIPQTSGSV